MVTEHQVRHLQRAALYHHLWCLVEMSVVTHWTEPRASFFSSISVTAQPSPHREEADQPLVSQ